MTSLKLYITPETSYLASVVRKLAKEYAESAVVIVIDVKSDPQKAEEDNVLVVPMLLYSGNGLSQVLIGRCTEDQIQEFLMKYCDKVHSNLDSR